MRYRRIVIPRFVTLKMQEELVKIGVYDVELDRVIDSLRIRYDIHIYNTAPPFVSPIEKKVVYGLSIKKCSPKWGWNARQYIGSTKWYTSIYNAKRAAIKMAAYWILNQKNKKVSKKKKNGKIKNKKD